MVLVNRTTASWVSKSLLARVNACQLTDDAEALERDDSPETVARFVSAVASVCIPREERTKFVAGIVQLHSRPDARVPTLARARRARGARRVRSAGKRSPARAGRGAARSTSRPSSRPSSPSRTFTRAPATRRAQPGHGRAYLPRAELRHGEDEGARGTRETRGETRGEGEDGPRSTATRADGAGSRAWSARDARAAENKDGGFDRRNEPRKVATLVQRCWARTSSTSGC